MGLIAGGAVDRLNPRQLLLLRAGSLASRTTLIIARALPTAVFISSFLPCLCASILTPRRTPGGASPCALVPPPSRRHPAPWLAQLCDAVRPPSAMSSLFRLRRMTMGKEQELLAAVRQQNMAVVFKIVQKNAKSKSFLSSGKQKRINFNFQDCEGMAACHHAAVAGNTQMLATLLENGANIDLQDNRGLRPIHFACAHGRTEAVHLLLRWGSSPNAGAGDGCTPLHLACQNGHVDVVKLLIYNHGDVNIRSHEGRTPFDLACEYGRFLVVDLLLSSNLVQHQLHARPVDPAVPEHFTCLHLSAQNGHTDVLRLLIKQPGVDINRRMPRGTCLHEAAAAGHYHTAKMLLENGIDPHKTNGYGQIASEVVPPGKPNGKELKQMLQEACFAIRAEAVRDFCDLRNPKNIAFREGESVTVLEQCPDGMWKGYVTQDGMARTGYFPGSAVRLLSPSDRSADAGVDCTFGPDERFPPPPSPHAVCAPAAPGDTPPPLPPPPHYAAGPGAGPGGVDGAAGTGPVAPAPALLTCAGGSNRNSAASVDSGRSSAHTAGSESGRSVHGSGSGGLACYSLPQPSGAAPAGGPPPPAVSGAGCGRSSMQSMESGLCRQSYVSSSSSSSLGSLDHLESGGPCCGGAGGHGLGLGSAVDADSAYSSTGTASARSLSLLSGSAALSPCSLRTWLQEAGLGHCAEALLGAGYDLGTATRMTPEDMNAAGITNPTVRKRLKAELSRACIGDGLPEFIPENVAHWVKCLNLDEYCDTLMRQGYTTVDKVMDITWEDLEDIGIKRLGHQKKIILAIERLRRLKKGSESALAAAAAAANAGACPPRPSRFHHHHHHHHHHHQPTLHTPPPGAAGPPPTSAVAASVQTHPQPPQSPSAGLAAPGSLTPKRTPRHSAPGDELRACPAQAPSPGPNHCPSPSGDELGPSHPPPSPRTAVVPPTVAPKPTPPRLPLPPSHATAPGPPCGSPGLSSNGKPVAKIPPGRLGPSPLSPGPGATGSLERKRQPPPPPPKRITSMKSGSASPQTGSPVRRHASPAATRRHNYENLKTPTKPDAPVSALAAAVANAERRKASLEQQQLQALAAAAAAAASEAGKGQGGGVEASGAVLEGTPKHCTPKKQNSVPAVATTDKVVSSIEKVSKSAGVHPQQQQLVSPFGTSTMRRSSAPSDRRHHQGTPPHVLVASAHRARRSPEMTDDSCLVQGELSECLKSRSSSTLSVESNSLPFANENVGTIKQRSNTSSKPSLSSLDFYASLDLNVGSYTAENGTIRRKTSPPGPAELGGSPLLDSPRKCPPPVPRRRDSIGGSGEGEEESATRSSVPHDQEQLDDICDMLEDLSDMLEREIAEDEQLRAT